MSNSAFDELGAKVRRAQSVVREIFGVGRVGGIAVEVDAENRPVALHHPDAHIILTAYRAALQDKQPQVDGAMSDVLSDPDAQKEDYTSEESLTELRTPGYNTAVVFAGLGEVPGLLVTGDSALQTGGIDLLNQLTELGR